MTRTTSVCVCFLLIGCVTSQRSPYAGRRPIGYPEMDDTSSSDDALGNRFADGETTTRASGTTERLPLEALGDRNLVNRISRLPIDQQPFWYINWKALEDHRNNPQTYAQKPNPFIDQPSNFPINNQAMVNNVQTSQSPLLNTFKSGQRNINSSRRNSNS